MHRLFAFLTMLALVLSFAAGTVASATAPIPCANVEQAAGGDVHYEGDADEVAADEDGGFPHHHGTGHDHGVGLVDARRSVPFDAVRGQRPVPGRQEQTAGVVADSALRPPTA